MPFLHSHLHRYAIYGGRYIAILFDGTECDDSRGMPGWAVKHASLSGHFLESTTAVTMIVTLYHAHNGPVMLCCSINAIQHSTDCIHFKTGLFSTYYF